MSRLGRFAAPVVAVIAIVVITGGAWCRAAPPVALAVPRLELAGALRFPAEVDTAPGATVATVGASGITWLGGATWCAVMDTGTAFVRFSLDLAADGTPRAVRDARAVPFAVRHDYEDVAPCPAPVARRFAAAAAGDGLLVSEEDTPAVHVVDSAGAIVGAVSVPAVLATRRPNRGLESLCVAADGASLWTANEEALPDDGPPPTAGVGTVVRLVEVRLAAAAGAAHGRHLAYAVDPPHACVPEGARDIYSGVVALAALPDGRLLVLERSAARCLPPFENRIYIIDPAAAVDVAGVPRGLAARPELHAAKQLAWRGAIGCNLEGLAVGPPLAAGGTAVVAISDAGGLDAPTQLVVLRMDPPITSP